MIQDLKPWLSVLAGASVWINLHYLYPDVVNQHLFILATMQTGAHRTGREHVTAHVHSIDGEIQTWRTYHKYSSFRIWIFYDETGNI